MWLVVIATILVIIDLLVLWLALSGAPYIPTKAAGVERIIACCELKPGLKAADLGSGDGWLVIALARAGAEAHGFEINPLLVWWSRRKVRQAGLEELAFIHWQNLWRADLSSFDYVTLFGATHIMRRLENKLRRELKPGSRVISLGFQFPTWPLQEQRGAIYIYQQV